jgi:polyphosphate kinase
MKLKHLLQSPFTLHKGVLERIEPRDRARSRGPPRPDRGEDERAQRTAGDARACTSLAGRREGRPDRARRLHLAGRHRRHFGEHPRALGGRSLPRTQRVWWFGNDGQPELYCSSADWLERNLLRRVETAFPILDAECARRVHQEGLLNYLLDNQNAWEVQPDGSYAKCIPAAGEEPFSAQLSLLDGLYA